MQTASIIIMNEQIEKRYAVDGVNGVRPVILVD